VLGVTGELDADTCEVCGSLCPLLKGLNNQDGASLAREPRAEELRGAFEDVADIVERKEWIEDCDGEALNPLNKGVATAVGESSGGRSMITRLGLSSIGAIFVDMIEFRCAFHLSLAFRIVIPPNDVTELRFGFEIWGPATLRENMSMSNLSASALGIGMSCRVSVGGAKESSGSGKKGTSMLETTSKSRRPSI